ISACDANLDVTSVDPRGQLGRSFGEHVEEPNADAGLERGRDPASSLGDRLVSQRGQLIEIVLQRVEMSLQLHNDVIMTSSRCLSNFAAKSPQSGWFCTALVSTARLLIAAPREK